TDVARIETTFQQILRFVEHVDGYCPLRKDSQSERVAWAEAAEKEAKELAQVIKTMEPIRQNNFKRMDKAEARVREL
ncbi:hypothetical protein LAJ55_16180, partial [Streptococcus pneumoniae]|uniref:hypothetical protein n=1 Tax=Streptococcus pneumoniae TaxID=1313 RepID=UPI001CC01B6F